MKLSIPLCLSLVVPFVVFSSGDARRISASQAAKNSFKCIEDQHETCCDVYKGRKCMAKEGKRAGLGANHMLHYLRKHPEAKEYAKNAHRCVKVRRSASYARKATFRCLVHGTPEINCCDQLDDVRKCIDKVTKKYGESYESMSERFEHYSEMRSFTARYDTCVKQAVEVSLLLAFMADMAFESPCPDYCEHTCTSALDECDDDDSHNNEDNNRDSDDKDNDKEDSSENEVITDDDSENKDKDHIIKPILCSFDQQTCTKGCEVVCACHYNSCQPQCAPAYEKCKNRAGKNALAKLQCGIKHKECTGECQGMCAAGVIEKNSAKFMPMVKKVFKQI